MNDDISEFYDDFFINVGEAGQGNNIDRYTRVVHMVEIFTDGADAVLCDGHYSKYIVDSPSQRDFNRDTLKRSKNKKDGFDSLIANGSYTVKTDCVVLLGLAKWARTTNPALEAALAEAKNPVEKNSLQDC